MAVRSMAGGVLGYCLYVNFHRPLDEGKEKDKDEGSQARDPREDPGFPYHIMLAEPDLNPALYNQNCKFYKDGKEQDVFSRYEASPAAVEDGSRTTGVASQQTEGMGLAADARCDPLDPDKSFGQEVRAALRATNAAINAEEEKQKQQNYASRLDRALKSYDHQPGPAYIKDDFSLFGLGAYSQFYRVEENELLGEVALLKGKEQVVSSSTITMVGEALSTTWINGYARAAGRPTSFHYREMAEKMAERMAAKVDEDACHSYRRLINDSRNQDEPTEINHMTEAKESGEWSIPWGSMGPVGVIGPLPPLTYGREIDKDNKGLRLLTGMFGFTNPADTVDAINARPANGGFVASLGQMSKNKMKAIGHQFESCSMVEPLAKSMFQFWVDGRRKKRRLANAFADFIPEKPRNEPDLEKWAAECTCAIGPVQSTSSTFFSMLSRYPDYYEPCRGVGELREKFCPAGARPAREGQCCASDGRPVQIL